MARFANPSRLQTASRLALVVLAVITVLLTTSLLLAVLLDWLGVSDDFALNALLGLICSLVTWLFVVIFHLRRDRIVVPVPDRTTFLGQVRLLLDEMGYEVTRQTADSLIARPRFNAFLFGDGLRVNVEGAQAMVQGPKILAEILRSRLRLLYHLFHVQAVLQEDRKNVDAVLRRVELSLRCRPGQLAAVQEQVLAPLARCGDVLLDIHIQVQNADGVPTSALEQLRPWMRKNDIACDFPRRPLKSDDTGRAAECLTETQPEAVRV